MLIKATIPVTGPIYCIATDYLLLWLATTFGKEYAALILLALVLTVLVMGIQYSKGIVKVKNSIRLLNALFYRSCRRSAIRNRRTYSRNAVISCCFEG